MLADGGLQMRSSEWLPLNHFFCFSLHLLNCLHLDPWVFLGFALPVLSLIPVKGRKAAAGGCSAAGLGQPTMERHQEKAQKTFYWYISAWEILHFAFNWPYNTKKQVLLLILKTLNSYTHTKTDCCPHCVSSKLDPKLVQLNGNINRLYTGSSRTRTSQNRSPRAETTFGLHCILAHTHKKTISFMQSLFCLYFLNKLFYDTFPVFSENYQSKM